MTDKIKIERIDPNPNQPRQSNSDESIAGLAESISEVGLKIPILVRPKDDRFEVVHGHRRLAACKSLGWTEMQSDIEEMSDDEAFLISLIENVARENLTAIEEARAYKQLQDKGATQTQIASKIGKTQSYVAQKLRLLTLNKGIHWQLMERYLDEGHARQLLRLPGIFEKYETNPEAKFPMHGGDRNWAEYYQDILAFHHGKPYSHFGESITVAEMEVLVNTIRFNLFEVAHFPSLVERARRRMKLWWQEFDAHIKEAKSKGREPTMFIDDIPGESSIVFMAEFVKPKLKEDKDATDEFVWFFREHKERFGTWEDEYVT